MNLHFLINISSDTENLYGVRFFSSFFQNSCSCNVTLFHISRLDSSDSQSLLEMWQGPIEGKVDGALTVGAKRAMEKAGRSLEHNQVVIEEMKTKTVKERYGKVKDILMEGKRGLYDAIILGRRATYALQWLVERSADEIPLALINDASLNCPLWICSEPEAGRKNVLLCVDGSPAALRAADHVGYILGKARHHGVTLFHVLSNPAGNADDILKEAAEVLLSHGIEKERIRQKSHWGLSVPNTILGEKNSGQYAAVAVGLNGSSEGVLTTLGLHAGTTATLIKKISKAALWCCP
jgi:hypothetical protein